MNKISVWTRLSSLLIICLSLLALLVSCDVSDETVETTGADEVATSGEETTAAPPTTLCIAADGISDFRMVAPEFPTEAEEDAFFDIRSEITAMTGVSLSFTDDWIRQDDMHDPEAYEILIGQTNYEETQSILNETSYGSYTIAVVGRKIVLTAWSEKAILKGAEALVQIFRESLNGQDLVVPVSLLSASKVVDRTLDYIPVVPNLRMNHIYDANGAIEAIYENATTEHFSAYVSKLENEGYTKYAQNERGRVNSALLTNYSDYTFNVFYEGGYEQLCVLVEKYSKQTLPPKESAYTKICETQFVQLGVEYKYGSSAPQNGMCYVWRLEDGKFVILDGGFNYKLGADNLFNTLTTMAVNPDDITVAAWVVSHFHGDHVGTLVQFVQNYMNEAEIETLLFNLPTDEQASLAGMNSNSWNKIKSRIKVFNPHIRIYKAHPGQIYHFANVELEILYTLEMYAPEDLTYYNTCSLVVDMRFGDFNMLMLGDCSEDANRILCNNYGDALKSEVVQVAHHGYTGGTTALYTFVDPIYVFWPAGSNGYNTFENKVLSGNDVYRNAYFFKDDTRIRMIYVGRSAVILLTLSENVGFTDYSIYQNVTSFIEGQGTTTELPS